MLQTYDELMTLAEQGDEAHVNTQCGDMRGDMGADMYSMMPDEGMVFTFGKAMFKDKCKFHNQVSLRDILKLRQVEFCW